MDTDNGRPAGARQGRARSDDQTGTLFAADVDDVTVIGSDSETGAQYVARWPAGQEYLRPATTANSLGPPEPVRRLLSVR